MNYRYLAIFPMLFFATACDREDRSTNADNQAATATMDGDVISPNDMFSTGSAMSGETIDTIGSGEGSRIGSTEPGATTSVPGN